MAGNFLRSKDSELEHRLRKVVEGDVLFDDFSRGRYATDASMYQMTPLGIVTPKTTNDVEGVFSVAAENATPMLPRGAGTSQCGQTVNEALIIDTSKYLDQVVSLEPSQLRATVEPGLVLDQLNQILKPYGLWFPVDISTSSQATIGGMVGNNSCGARSIRYGTMRDNVVSIKALLTNGEHVTFGSMASEVRGATSSRVNQNLTEKEYVDNQKALGIKLHS